MLLLLLLQLLLLPFLLSAVGNMSVDHVVVVAMSSW
jgi:hypothetical protein